MRRSTYEVKMTDANKGRRLRIVGDERSYKVYTVEPDGPVRELPNVTSVTVYLHRSGICEAQVFFSNPEIVIEAPRASDGVRAG